VMHLCPLTHHLNSARVSSLSAFPAYPGVMVKNVTTRSASRSAPSLLDENGSRAGFALPPVTTSAVQPAPRSQGSLDDLGPRLGEMRRALGMTQLDVAFKMGTTQPALARLEKGEAKANLRTLSRYAAALGRRAVVQLTPASTGAANERRAGLPAAGKEAGKASASASAVGAPTRMIDLEALPAALALMRKERGVTQSEVANRMATTQPVIARLESGDGIPNLTTLERFSQAIGASLGVSFEAPL
jgi:transcriptional regulator with XRE-family HTH domain